MPVKLTWIINFTRAIQIKFLKNEFNFLSCLFNISIHLSIALNKFLFTKDTIIILVESFKYLIDFLPFFLWSELISHIGYDSLL